MSEPTRDKRQDTPATVSYYDPSPYPGVAYDKEYMAWRSSHEPPSDGSVMVYNKDGREWRLSHDPPSIVLEGVTFPNSIDENITKAERDNCAQWDHPLTIILNCSTWQSVSDVENEHNWKQGCYACRCGGEAYHGDYCEELKPKAQELAKLFNEVK